MHDCVKCKNLTACACTKPAHLVGPDRGWICPKCEKSYAPWVTECYGCNSGALKAVPVIGPNTTVPKFTSTTDVDWPS